MHEETLCQICRVLGDRVCTVQIHGARHMDIVLGGRVIICGLRKQTRLPHRCLMQRKLDNARKRKPPSNSCAFNVTVWSLTSGDWNNKAFFRYPMDFCQDARVLLQSFKTVCKTWELASWYQLVCETKCLQTILDLRRPSNFRRMKRPKNVKCPVNVDVYRPGHLYLGHQPWSCRQHLDDGSDADKNDFQDTDAQQSKTQSSEADTP